MARTLKAFFIDEAGATAIEYGLIAALIAVGIVAGMTTFGGGLSNMFGAVSSKSADAMGG